MMRIAIEIHPGGDSSRKRTIAEVEVANISELSELSDYTYVARVEGHEPVRGCIFQYLRSHGAVRLAARVLGDAYAAMDLRSPQATERKTP